MDRLDRFRVFARVVESASFSRAADGLGLPRSTVSAAIQDLERRLGTRLLHRTTRKVAPTPDGRALYDRCRELVGEADAIDNMFRTEAEGPSGHLRVDLPGRIGRLVVAPALPGFLSRYPGIRIHLGMTDRAVDLIEDGVDCVLRAGALPDSRLIGRKIGDLDLVNVASPDYLRTYGTPRTPADLHHHLSVGYASPSTGRIEDWEWVEGGRARRMTMRSHVTVNSAEAYIACCIAGMGLIQIPAYDVADDVAAGRLVEVLPGHRAAAMPLTLLYPHRHTSPQVQLFSDWAAGLFRPLLSLKSRWRRRGRNG